MLNKPILLQQLQTLTNELFLDFRQEIDIAYQSWQRICNDPTFGHKIEQSSSPWLVPTWYESLSRRKKISPYLERYSVLSVDGSQIYPDRHQGTNCFLVNIGSTLFNYYQPQLPTVAFNSRPFVFIPEEVPDGNSIDLVDCKRQELELEIGLAISSETKKQLDADTPFLFLFDGSLIFWHLESKSTTLREIYVNRYMHLLQGFYDQDLLCAGYISLPKSKELVNLIRIELCNFMHKTDIQSVDHVVDTVVARFFLQQFEHSIIFKSNAKIGSAYPLHLMPHFFYFDVGQEIVRIEVPTWIARDEQKLALVAQIILNQVVKGSGYPVAIAEAHEQAVVKGPDREFFYQLITKFTIDHGRSIQLSQKNMKKRGMLV